MCFHKEKQKLNRTWNITKLYIKQIVFEFAFLIMLFSSCCFYFQFFKTEAWSTTHYKTKQSLFYVSDLFRKASGYRRTMDATWMGIIFLLFLQKRDLFFILFHQINVFQTIKSKNDKINYQANSHATLHNLFEKEQILIISSEKGAADYTEYGAIVRKFLHP